MAKTPKPRKSGMATASTKAAKPKPPAKAAGKPKGGSKPKGKEKSPHKAKAAPAVILKTDEGIKAKTVAGRPPTYKPEYAKIARKMCSMGASDADLAEAFGVSTVTIWRWQTEHQEFCNALKIEKGEYDERVKRSLAQRAIGYSYDAVKIFHPAGADAPVYAPYREHVPPDPGAAKIWLCNRQPDEWRDRKELTGKDGAPLVPVLNVMYGDGRSSSQPVPAS